MSTLALVWADLTAGAWVEACVEVWAILAVPAIAGAARTETASKAAEIVFNMGCPLSTEITRLPVGWPGSLIMSVTLMAAR